MDPLMTLGLVIGALAWLEGQHHEWQGKMTSFVLQSKENRRLDQDLSYPRAYRGSEDLS